VVDSYTGLVQSNDSWSINVTAAQAQALADGSYTVTANVSDIYGNPATQASQTVTVDETPSSGPTLTITDHTLTANPGDSVPLGISESPQTSGDPVTVTISGIPSDATLSDSNGDTLAAAAGSITLTPPELVGLTLTAGTTSGTLTVTASEMSGQTGTGTPVTVDFDAVNTSSAPVTGTPVADFLAGYGITLTTSNNGAEVSVANQDQIYGGGIVEATTGYNVIGEGSGTNGAHPDSYTLTFATPLSSFAFDQVIENSGPSGSSYAAWSATAYNAADQVVDSVGDPNVTYVFSGSDPGVTYTLTGSSDITSVTFTGDDQGFAGFANIVTDNWVLTPESTLTSSSQTISLNVETTDNWTGADNNGEWSDANNWSAGVPGANSEVDIAVSGATVTFDMSSDTIRSLNTDADTTLSISIGNSLTITSSAGMLGSVENAGTLDVANGTVHLVDNSGLVEVTGGTLFLTGDVDNASGSNGYIAAYNGSTIQLAAGVTITDGTITIGTSSDTDDTLLVGSGDSAALQNLNVNSYGTVLIDSGATLTLEGSAIFRGTVTDNGSNGALDSNGNSAINNAQLTAQVAVTSGTLTLDDVTFAGTLTSTGASTLQVDSNNTLWLNGATIEGGTITNNGTVEVTADSTIDNGATVSGGGSGNITVEYGETLTLGNGAHDSVTLGDVTVYDYGTVTVNGTLTLNGSSSNFSGGGGTGGVIVNNGTIDVTDSATFASSANMSGGDITIGSGATLTLEGVSVGSDITNTGTVQFNESVTYSGTLTNVGGSGASVTLSTSATLTLSGATVEGGTITNSGTIEVSANSTVDDGAVVSGGVITIDSGETLTFGNGPSDTVTLSGVTITDNGTVTIASGATLTFASSSSNVIDGGGAAGTVVNHGNIDLEVSATFQDGVAVDGGTIAVGPTSTLHIENGLGTAGATLDGVTLYNSGTIQVDLGGGGPATVDLVLTDGSVVHGGTIAIGGSGEVEVQHGSGLGPDYGATFDSGITVSNQGTITVDSGATLTLVGSTATTIIGTSSGNAQTSGSQTHGAINNSGAIALGTAAASATLDIGATVTLYGSGTLTLENSGDVVTGASGGGELFNYGTIAGAGSIDNSSGNGLTLTNEAGGVIDANAGGGATFTLNTGNTIDNSGLIEGTNGGDLVIEDSVVNSGAGAAVADGGTVTVNSGGAVAGGILEITNGGTLDLLNSSDQNVTFVGAGTLDLAQSQSYSANYSASGINAVNGFGLGDTIDLQDLEYSSSETAVWTQGSGGGTLALSNTSGPLETLHLNGSYTQADFVLANDGAGDTEVIFNPVALPAGPVAAVENTPRAISGITINDPAAGGNTLIVTLAVNDGTLLVASGVNGGLTNGEISYNGTGTVTLTGTEAEIDATLAAANGVTYEGNLGFTGSGAHSDTLTVTENDSSAGFTAEASVAINVEPAFHPSLWASVLSPAEPNAGTHLYGAFLNTPSGATNGDLVAVMYGDTSSGYSNAGPDTITNNLSLLDPFMLPYQNGSQVIDITSIADFPHNRAQLQLASVSTTQTEALGFLVSEDGSGNATINQFTFNEGTSDLNAPVTVSALTPVETGLIGNDLVLFASIETNSSGFFTGAGASYSLAWGQYDSGTDTYTADFQIFNPDGTTGAESGNPSGTTPSPIQIFSTGSVNGFTEAPAWFFRSDGTNSSGAVVYGAAFAELNPTTQSDYIQFQSYTVTGAETGPAFQITPDLSAYAPGATAQITQEADSANHTSVGTALQFTTNSGANSGYSLAWNETVTDSNGVHDQVEFAIFHPAPGGGTLVSQSTFQIADGDAQSIQLLATSINGVNVELLAYGDDTGTHVVEFDSAGNILGTLFDPSTVMFGRLIALGDGRIELTYDNTLPDGVTTQYQTDIFDLRTAGVNINDSGVTDGKDKYVAGTQFNDTFTGENNVNNTYYFVGSASGTAPTDSFTGGGGAAWNVAILPDARSNYTITTNGSETTLVNTGDPSHSGTLNLTGVQEVVFNPSVDPSGNSGLLEAFAGSTVIILGPLSNVSEPAQIDNGATLQFNIAESGTVTFATGATGTLVLEQPATFTGTIAGLAAGDVIDLAGTIATSATISGSTLIVKDGTATVDTFNISGAQSGDVVVVGGDGNAASPGSDLMIEPAAYVWNDITFPAVTGTHLYGPFINANTGLGVVGVGFSETTSSYTDAGPDVISNEVKTLDPFLLPDSGSAGTVSVGTSATFPTADGQFSRQSLSLVSPSSGTLEGLQFYEVPDGSGGLGVDLDILAEGSGPDSPLQPSPTPITLIAGGITGKGFSFSPDNTSTGILASYAGAWDDFNSTTGTFSIQAEAFTTANAAASAVTTLLGPTSGFASYQNTPAWLFRGAGSSTSSDPYGLAYSTGNGTTSAGIKFQPYTLPASSTSQLVAGTPFFIAANLSAYAAGATDQITEETSPSNHTGVEQALQYTNVPNLTNLAFAWNDTVTDSNGSHDQVEFAITTATGAAVGSQVEFQIADGNAQNIRLASYSLTLSGVTTNYVVLAYGDANGTNLVEFNASNGQEIASYFDPSTQPLNQLTALGDGRVVVTYDDVVGNNDATTQYVSDVIDFRTSGIVSTYTGITNGTTHDFAGTRFDDVVQGTLGANNTYYYVGDNTTVGTGPTDSFTGGNVNGSTHVGGWNIAVFGDARSDYKITPNGTDAATIVNIGDPTHAGTLIVSNVQELVFGPTSDPSESGSFETSGGTIDVTGGTFVILAGGSTETNNPITIEAGATAELDAGSTGTPYTGSVTFEASSGTLRLDQPGVFTGSINDLTAGDIIDLAGVDVQSARLSGSTLTVTEANGGGTLTYTVSGAQSGDDFVVHGDGNGGSDLVLSPAGYLWGSNAYPSPVMSGEHLFFAADSFNEGLGVDALLYGETSDYQPTGTNSVTENAIGFDPFLLPIGSDTPVALTDSPLSLTVPIKYQLTLANLGPGQGEGIAVYVTEGTTDTINEAVITGGAGPDGGNPLTVGASSAIESNLSGTIENLFVGSWDPSGQLSTFDVAWDQYDSVGQTYQAYFQIFNASGTALGTPTEVYNLTGGVTSLSAAPAWFFGGTAPITSDGTSVPYALATALSNGDLQYQGYLAAGTQAASVDWTLTPNLTAYEAGATSQITQEVQANGTTSGSALQLAGINGQIVAGWNETVTDGAGTHDQVEFAIFDPNTLNAGGSPVAGTLISQTAFQIADGDAQNIRVGSFVFNGSTFEYLVYGDTTATHIVEFNASGHEIASITDPINFTTTLPYSQIENFDDGRIGIIYNEPVGTDGTTQYVTNIYDLRTTGLNETLQGTNNYVAGTEFNDTVTGANGGGINNGVGNFYYYIGQDASGQGASDTGATDVFNGGNDSWNVAILAGTRADYSVEANGSGGYVVTYIDPDQAHAGSLTVNQNVEALAFNPAIDPSPDNGGAVEASGDTLMLLTQFTQNASIDAGSTLEFAQIASSGTVTFDGSTGTLRLDDAPAFSDAIADFTGNGTLAGSDHIDLADINLNSSQFGAVYNAADDTLSVTDGTNTANLYFSTGSFTQANFAFTTDGNGGTLVYDPPTSVGEPSVLSSATADGASGSISFADSDTASAISASVTPDGTNYTGDFTLDQPTENNGIVSVGFEFMNNDGQVNLASGETLTQSYNVTVADAQNPAANQSQTVSVSIGGPGNDNFVFAPGIGADTVINFNPQQDTIELDHFSNAQTVQELQALISTDAHGDAVINLGHNDSITLAGVTETQLQHVVQAGHVLLH
jgi:hypothetical protein